MNKIIIKNKEQIAGIKKSCQLAANTLKHVEPFVKEGVTTNELNDVCEKYIRDNGGIPASLNYGEIADGEHRRPPFPKSICTSLNEVVCHGIPDDTKLKEGDILNIDVATILDGYYGDTCKMYSVGKISEDAKHLLKVSKKCLEIGINQVKPGNYFSNIGYHITQYAMLQNYSIVWQFTGHNVGIAFHEFCEINHYETRKDRGPVMQKNMIFTIEPMISQGSPDIIIDDKDFWTVKTIDRKLSSQFEHTILVTERGYEILTL